MTRFTLMILVLILGSCASDWQEQYLRKDKENIKFRRKYVKGKGKFRPTLRDKNCLQVVGFDSKKLLSELNGGLYSQSFELCKQDPLFIEVRPSSNQNGLAVDRDAVELKQLAKSKSIGGGLLGLIFLSSISTVNPTITARASVIIRANDKEEKLEVETAPIVQSRIISPENPKGDIDLEKNIAEKIASFIKPNLQIYYEYQNYMKKLVEVKVILDEQDYEYRWALHHEDYLNARIVLDKAIELKPNMPELYYNRAILLEASRSHTKAFDNYRKAALLDKRFSQDFAEISKYIQYKKGQKKYYNLSL